MTKMRRVILPCFSHKRPPINLSLSRFSAGRGRGNPHERAIRIHGHGGPEVLRYDDIELPPPGPGQARVRHTAIGINYSDVNVRRGGFYLNKKWPFPAHSRQ